MQTLSQLSTLLKQRREQLALNQKDMLLKIGMSQQQYQRVESGNDLRVSTLLRILEGFGLQLLVIEKQQAALLESLSKQDPVKLQQMLLELTQYQPNTLPDFLTALEDDE